MEDDGDDEYHEMHTYYGFVERSHFAPMTDDQWNQLRKYLNRVLDKAMYDCQEIIGIVWDGGEVSSDREDGVVMDEETFFSEERKAKKQKTKSQQEIYQMLLGIVQG